MPSYSEAAVNAKNLKKRIAEQAGVETNYVNDTNLVEAQKMLQGAQQVHAAGGDPTAVDPAELKSAGSGEAPVQSAKPAKQDEPEELSKQQKIAMAIVSIAPTLLGYAFGGKEGGAIGAQQSVNAIQGMSAQENENRKAARDLASKKELANQQLAEKREMHDKDLELKRELADQADATKRELAALVAGGKTQKGTVGQQALDRKFAVDYNDWNNTGGYGEAQKNLKVLKGALVNLQNTDTASGPIVGSLPKWMRDIGMPEGSSIQDAIESVAQRSMRQIYGPQFTAEEGKAFLARQYNPRQSEKENAKRLTAFVEGLEQAAAAKQQASEYWENNEGSLKGYRGSVHFAAPGGDDETAVAGGGSGAKNPLVDDANAAPPLRNKELEQMDANELEAHNKKLRSMLKKPARN